MNISYVEDNPVDADLLICKFARIVPKWSIAWGDTLAKAYTKLEEIEKNMGIIYDARAVGFCIKLFREDGFVFEQTGNTGAYRVKLSSAIPRLLQ